MSADKFQNKYRVPSARAAWHDYGGGAYFITVCTKNREHFFGRICNGQMEYTKIATFLNDNILYVNQNCAYCEIPLFVIMPNHWHAIVFIDGEKIPYQRRDMPRTDVACRVSMDNNTTTEMADHISTGDAAGHVSTGVMQNIAICQGWLSVVIGGIKSAVTKYANENEIDFAWLPRFHDHIIRDQNEMNRIADYIENNPLTWDTDRLNEPSDT